MIDWREAPLAELLSAVIDYRGKTPTKSDTGVPLITAKVIKDGRITKSRAEFIPPESYAAWMRRGLPQQGDILVTTEAPLGEVAQIKTTERVALAQRVILLRPDPSRVVPQFVFHFLRSDEGRARMLQRSSGTTVAGIRQPELLAVRIPLLPARQQTAAAAVLDAFDELIAINERRIELLEDLARSLYREWFVRCRFPGHGPDLAPPPGWTRFRVGDFAEVVTDGVDPGDVPHEMPYLGLEHLPRRSTTLREWGSTASVTSRKLRFQAGDTLFGKIRPYFHKVVWSAFDGVASSDAIVFRVANGVRIPGLLATVLSSDALVAEAVATSNGTKMPRADPKAILNYRVSLPPLDGELLWQAEDVLRATYDLAAKLAFENTALARTRDLLLPRLITGRLDISVVDLGDLLPAETAA